MKRVLEAAGRSWERIAGFVRTRRTSACALAAHAGRGRARADFSQGLDRLEDRRLLFTLTVPDDGLGTGYGQVDAVFAYVIPYLFIELPDEEDEDPETIEENFDGADPNDIIFSGFRFDSNLEVNYSGQTPFLINPPPTDDGDFDLRVSLSGTNQFTFAYIEGEAPFEQNRVMTNVRFNVPRTGVDALDTTLTGTKIELLDAGAVVQTFSGAALAALGTVNQATNEIQFRIDRPLGFDAVRFSSANADTTTYFDQFTLDQIVGTFPTTRFAGIIEQRIFATWMSFYGPVGSSVQIFDLYGRDMVQTIQVGTPPGASLPNVDRNGDGVPSFNDGIGRIVMRGTDIRSNLTMYGGRVTAGDPPDQGNIFVGGPFYSELVDSQQGMYDDFEGAGFGYALSPDGQAVVGLPPGAGSVIIGSPVVRNNSSPNAYLIPVAGNFSPDAFNAGNQGIFVEADASGAGRSVGSVLIHGLVHGSSRFSGAVKRLSFGTLLGSLQIEGDLGTLTVASDAGTWVADAPTPPTGGPFVADPLNTTRSLITVGRTVGEIAIGGRMLSDISVLADLSNPSRARADFIEFPEREVQYGAPEGLDDDFDQQDVIAVVLNSTATTSLQAAPFGLVHLKNDTVLSAEFVGSSSTSVRVSGLMGNQDPVNAADDPSDVFAFAAIKGQRVTFDAIFDIAGITDSVYARVVDANGRTIAGTDYTFYSDERLAARETSGRFFFTPEIDGVYYLVLNLSVDGQFDFPTTNYAVQISGMAPVTFGSLRVAQTVGAATDPVAVSLRAGSMGLYRAATGLLDGSGGESDGGDIVNTGLDGNERLRVKSSSISVPGNLYSYIAGGDITGSGGLQPDVLITVGGNLGSFITGLSPSVGGGIDTGDIVNLDLRVGGSISLFEVHGSILFFSDYGVTFSQTPRVVNVITGLNPSLRGDIGVMRIGNHVEGRGFNVRTSRGAIIDVLSLGTDSGDDGNSGDFDEGPASFLLGSGASIRFLDFDRIETGTQGGSDISTTIPLIYNIPVRVTDDSGNVLIIQLADGLANAVGSFGSIVLLPVSGAPGAAIGRITANLVGNANLRITSERTGSVGLGRLLVTTDSVAGDTAGSQIIITGPGEIDVLRIDVTAGVLQRVQNLTPGGDIVSIDASGLERIEIGSGNLGSTQVSAASPARLGRFLGIQGGLNATVGGAIGLNAASVVVGWNGQLYVPVNQRSSDFNADFYLEDLGSPLDPYLDGVIVRAGNVQEVLVSGSVGDVILQGGNLVRLVANNDLIRAAGAFDGIVGNIYAVNILEIDIGDGLAARGDGPLARASIVADNNIVRLVAGRRYAGVVISGLIIAADNTFDGQDDGLALIEATNARFDGAFIGSSTLDSWWLSQRFVSTRVDTDDTEARGFVGELRLTNTDFFRSTLLTSVLTSFRSVGGAIDASTIDVRGNAGTIIADEVRNSTRDGERREFRFMQFIISGDLDTLSTVGTGEGEESDSDSSAVGSGDMSDFDLLVQGDITGRLAARNFVRANVSVSRAAVSVSSINDVRSSEFQFGRLDSMIIGADLRSTSISVAGTIQLLTITGDVTSSLISTTGVDGRIETITAARIFNSILESTGPIATISTTGGDFQATVRTLQPGASVTALSASNDLQVTLDVKGAVGTLTAGRHIGRSATAGGRVLDTIDVLGDLGSVNAPNGQVYADIRVGGSITGVITTGRVFALPGNDQVSIASIRSFGRINALNFFGDLNSDIISESGGIGSITINNGSFRPGRTISARDGGIGSFTIIGGHLLGNVFAEGDIGAVRVIASLDGFAGDIGVNPNLSNALPFDQFRNQLPPDVAPVPTFQGARIESRQNIGLVEVTGASMWESSIIAGRSIGRVFVLGVILNDNVTPGLGGSFIVATDAIGSIEAGGFVGGAIIHAGIIDLGDDSRPGGTGANADTVRFGRIGDLVFRGGTGAVTISAGMLAGADGIYNTADDMVANGLSMINSVAALGPVLQTTAFADNGIGPTSPGIIRGGPGLNQAEPDKVIEYVPDAAGQVTPGVARTFLSAFGESFSVFYTGSGEVYYEASTNRLAIINSGLDTNVTIDGTVLTDFSVITNDGSSLGTVTIRPSLIGKLNVFVDGYLQNLVLGFVDIFDDPNDSLTTGFIGVGADIGAFTSGPISRGILEANHASSVSIFGDFGSALLNAEAAVRTLSAGSLFVLGAAAADFIVSRDLFEVRSSGAMTGVNIRAGNTITSVFAPSARAVRVSAGDAVNAVDITGDFIDSLIYAGGDLGRDGVFTPNPTNALDADTVSDGTIGTVTIGGNFFESDIGAGVIRGTDGFLGTDDDIADDGRSSIVSVTIGGSGVGSNLGSESYSIETTGSLGSVTIGGRAGENSGNFSVRATDANPIPVVVTDLRVTEEAQFYSVLITFNQPIQLASFAEAIALSEVRADGATLLRLSQDADYTLSFDRALNRATLRLAQAVTQRDLPVTAGVPGPGTYRVDIDAAVLRGESQRNLLDGNADGVPLGDDDDFSRDLVVGDAGDKLSANTVTVNGHQIDFYAPTQINTVLDGVAGFGRDGLPDSNSSILLQGSIGDHADTDTTEFREGSDADLYRVTLKGGQILRMGEIAGPARLAQRYLLDAAGNILSGTSGVTRSGVDATFGVGVIERLPARTTLRDDITVEDAYLIKETGTYFILVVGTLTDPQSGLPIEITQPGVVTNIPPQSGAVGGYEFTVEVFDDADSGFAGDTDSGDGVDVTNAPVPSSFAGPDGSLGTPDDLTSITTGRYVFTLDRGADAIPNTADDVVTGNNSTGITSQRTSGADGVFNTADDRVISFVAAAIGVGGNIGVPDQVQSDVDVYKLNAGQAIAPGTKVRVTLQLTEFGSNIGLLQPTRERIGEDEAYRVADLRGSIQFSLFDITGSSGVSDAVVVASPSKVLAVGGEANSSVSDGSTAYGFDANGDFFLEFVTRGRIGVASEAPASYALYVQGAVRSDYTLEVLTQGTGSTVTAVQNILIETRGGAVDWLQVGNTSTSLNGFSVSSLGLNGTVGTETVNNYVLRNVVENLEALYLSAGVQVNFSTNPAEFEGQEFSTVFLSGSNAPSDFFDNGIVADLGGFFGFFFFFDPFGGALRNTLTRAGTFGVTERVDALNANHNDEAIVFVPSISVLGYDPGPVGIENVIFSLTAAVGRRSAELLGVRTLASVGDTTTSNPDILGANSVQNVPTDVLNGRYEFSAVRSQLSDPLDSLNETNFFLGFQNDIGLLQRIIALT